MEGVIPINEALLVTRPLFKATDFTPFIQSSHPTLRKSANLSNYSTLHQFIQDRFGELFSTWTKILKNRTNQRRNIGAFLRPVSDQAFEADEKIGYAYYAIPFDFPNVRSTNMTKMGHSVLNLDWCSVPIGSEDNPTRIVRRNSLEYHMWQNEDDNFEMDMIMEGASVAIGELSEVSRKVQSERTPI
jgi:hypothetical protein